MDIDPKIRYCTICHKPWKPRTYHKIIMIIFGSYTRTCSQCGTRMKFKLMNHVVKIETITIKNKEKIWKKG